MYAPYGPYFAFIPEFLPQNVSGAAMGVINAFGALGGFLGAYVVGALGGGTKSGAAFIFMAASLLAAGLLMFLVKRPRVDRGREGEAASTSEGALRGGVVGGQLPRPTGGECAVGVSQRPPKDALRCPATPSKSPPHIGSPTRRPQPLRIV